MKETGKVEGDVCQLWEMLNCLKPKPQTVVSLQKETLIDLSKGWEQKAGNLWRAWRNCHWRALFPPPQVTQAHIEPWKENNGP